MGEVVWRNGTGKVIRRGDVVRVDGERGRFEVVAEWQLGVLRVRPLAASRCGSRFFEVERCHLDRRRTRMLRGVAVTGSR